MGEIANKEQLHTCFSVSRKWQCGVCKMGTRVASWHKKVWQARRLFLLARRKRRLTQNTRGAVDRKTCFLTEIRFVQASKSQVLNLSSYRERSQSSTTELLTVRLRNVPHPDGVRSLLSVVRCQKNHFSYLFINSSNFSTACSSGMFFSTHSFCL